MMGLGKWTPNPFKGRLTRELSQDDIVNAVNAAKLVPVNITSLSQIPLSAQPGEVFRLTEHEAGTPVVVLGVTIFTKGGNDKGLYERNSSGDIKKYNPNFDAADVFVDPNNKSYTEETTLEGILNDLDLSGVVFNVITNGQSYPQTMLDIDNSLLDARTTGIRSFSQPSVNSVSNTAMDIPAMRGAILDNSDQLNPTYSVIQTTAKTGIELTNTNAGLTYWYVDDDSDTIKQTNTMPTNQLYRQRIYLFITSYTASVGAITGFATIGVPIQQPSQQLGDAFRALGVFRTNGLKVSSNGANINFFINAGALYDHGANLGIDPLNPNIVSYSFFDSISNSFRYATSTEVIATNENEIDNISYQVNGVVTEIPGNILNNNSNSGVNYVYVFPGGNVRLVYDVDFYGDNQEAINSIGSKNPLDFAPPGFENGFLVGAIIFVKGTMDLSGSNANFFQTNQFGSLSGGFSVANIQEDNQNASEVPFDDSNTLLGIVNVQELGEALYSRGPFFRLSCEFAGFTGRYYTTKRPYEVGSGFYQTTPDNVPNYDVDNSFLGHGILEDKLINNVRLIGIPNFTEDFTIYLVVKRITNSVESSVLLFDSGQLSFTEDIAGFFEFTAQNIQFLKGDRLFVSTLRNTQNAANTGSSTFDLSIELS